MSDRATSSDPTAPVVERVIRTPDQRLRVFVSSTIQELAAERAAAREAIERLRLAPVMFELGARPHPPRDLYRAYEAQSHVFVGVYWESYGWVAPGESISGLEDELRLSGSLPRLIYVKEPARGRDPRLQHLLDGIKTDSTVSYRPFSSADELRTLIENDLAVLLTERFEQTAAAAVRRKGDARLRRRLPAPATALVGRTAELDAIHQLFTDQSARLVTLTGPGGVGKSRLALQVAGRLAGELADGAAFVPLAPLAEARQVPAAVADALGVEDDPSRSVPDVLAEELSTRRLLLVLDNFEHVDEAAPLIAELLSAAPGLSCLVTSRTPLRLYGEFEFPVPLLKLEEAISLFRTRARARGVTFPDAYAPFLGAVCQRLDCLPLAIELVAARAHDLSRDELSSVTGSLDLAIGPRDLPRRHQTLRATIGWSYDLLSPAGQDVFRRLSVFAGGCTAAAAQAIASSTLEGLSSLVAHNLLVLRHDECGRRFQMLETIHDYARERLAETREAELVARQHAEYFLAFAEQAEHQLRAGVEEGTWLDRLAADHDNLRAALAWSHRAQASELELRLAAALRLFWELRGHLGEGRAALTTALDQPCVQPPEARAKALSAAADIAYRQGDLKATGQLIEQSLALYRELGDAQGIARALSESANLAAEDGDHVRATRLYEECASMLRAEGNELGLATILANVGDLAFRQADYDRAASILEEAVKLQRRAGDRDGVATSLLTLSRVVFSQGSAEMSARLLGESLAIADEIGYPECIAYCLAGLGHVALAGAQWAQAARLFAAAEATFERIGAMMQQSEREAFQTAVSSTERLLGQAAFAANWAEGRALDPEHAVAEARSVVAANSNPSGA